MSKTSLPVPDPYTQLIAQIEQTVAEGRKKAVATIDQTMVATYWNVGRHIVQFEQNGKERAEYGSRLLHNPRAIWRLGSVEGLATATSTTCGCFSSNIQF
ncbi:MAG: hypothetical protein JNJ90_09880 [Saprospiraceae bacterium]|jgi:hypothetical protein|nr:hypothetical protein [Saprospiraceae bacterium]